MFKEIFKLVFGPLLAFVNFFVKFFKSLPGLITTLIKTFVYFVTNFIPLLIKGIKNIGVILQSIFYYLQNPTKIFSLFFKILVFIPLMMISILYHIPLGKKFKFGDLFMYVFVGVFYSLGFLITTIIYWIWYKLWVEYIILYNLDYYALKGGISTFVYRYLLACENPPDSWYETANYHHLNKNTKMLLLAYNKCPSGFIPNGIFCEKLPNYLPYYCEEAHIYKQYINEDKFYNPGLYFPKNFNQLTQGYLKKSSFDKEIEIENYINDVKRHNELCKRVHKSKDTLIKSICKDIDNVDKSNDLRTLCKRKFCVNEQQAFCHLYKDVTVKNGDIQESNPYLQLLSIIIFIFMLSIFSYVKYSKPA